ncbi:MAG: hypothetical protein INQ03_11735 [Candidatus Heimdallarchaeota archaeon]|nr:hypothetical protein [Candidatus Heimdallarchaeota archaeon]
MVDYKEASFIKGIIIVANSDIGPDLIANLSPIDDGNALITALHMVSLAGLEEDSQTDPDASKMLGPLPVKGSSDFKALYYSDMFKASNAEDERLKKYGAKIGIILIFDKDKLPDIRRASGLIEPHLQRYLEKIEETKDMDTKFAMELLDHIVDLVSKPRVRIFRVEEAGMYEYKDHGYIDMQDHLMILDETQKKMYFIAQKGISPFTLQVLRKHIDKANLDFYQGSYNISKLESFEEIEPLLLKHGIKVR